MQGPFIEFKNILAKAVEEVLEDAASPGLIEQIKEGDERFDLVVHADIDSLDYADILSALGKMGVTLSDDVKGFTLGELYRGSSYAS